MHEHDLVGVDVGRLNSMIVMGQPKTTAEYIRRPLESDERMVGVVLMNFSPTKPRDRSHFESFRRFHDALLGRADECDAGVRSGPRSGSACCGIHSGRLWRLPDDEQADLATMADGDLQDVLDRLVERLQSASGSKDTEGRIRAIFNW